MVGFLGRLTIAKMGAPALSPIHPAFDCGQEGNASACDNSATNLHTTAIIF